MRLYLTLAFVKHFFIARIKTSDRELGKATEKWMKTTMIRWFFLAGRRKELFPRPSSHFRLNKLSGLSLSDTKLRGLRHVVSSALHIFVPFLYFLYS
jgi:hypothetical protein